ncbi:MAG: hypothetical protein GX605_12560, partial [Chloroflexi bacterium]|nr:hypothetical protein [Chloroflexota bacterium]
MNGRWRLWALRVFFGLCLLALVGRLWMLQVLQGDYYRTYADRIRFRTVALE